MYKYVIANSRSAVAGRAPPFQPSYALLSAYKITPPHAKKKDRCPPYDLEYEKVQGSRFKG
jgi:hypothetical protein